MSWERLHPEVSRLRQRWQGLYVTSSVNLAVFLYFLQIIIL
jgi:hypothetical protein